MRQVARYAKIAGTTDGLLLEIPDACWDDVRSIRFVINQMGVGGEKGHAIRFGEVRVRRNDNGEQWWVGFVCPLRALWIR